MKRVFSNFFFWPALISMLLIMGVWVELGFAAFLLVLLLSVLEVTLSFDNAVVNARVLKMMSPRWQKRFLTWGILLAVFGTRFVLPIVIVSIALWISPIEVTRLVFTDPAEYGRLLHEVHGSIVAFGGVFLLMVSLKYFFDQSKSVHWIKQIEKRLVKWGHIASIEIGIALVSLVLLSFFTHFPQAEILVAGLVGLILFIAMEGVTGTLSFDEKAVAVSGASLFIYLNILDTAFSLDGVIGAFALTNNLVIIMIGLGIGAYFVRSITLFFVKKDTLAEFMYLEHGAHWAILGLALAMLTTLIHEVPEAVTGLIGFIFVSLALYSSIKAKRRDV